MDHLYIKAIKDENTKLWKHIGDRIVGIIKTNYFNGLIMDETLLLLLITLCYSFIFELHMKIHTYTLDCMKNTSQNIIHIH